MRSSGERRNPVIKWEATGSMIGGWWNGDIVGRKMDCNKFWMTGCSVAEKMSLMQDVSRPRLGIRNEHRWV